MSQEAILAASSLDLLEALKAHQSAEDHRTNCIVCDWEPCREWWPLHDAAAALTTAAIAKSEGKSE